MDSYNRDKGNYVINSTSLEVKWSRMGENVSKICTKPSPNISPKLKKLHVLMQNTSELASIPLIQFYHIIGISSVLLSRPVALSGHQLM